MKKTHLLTLIGFAAASFLMEGCETYPETYNGYHRPYYGPSVRIYSGYPGDDYYRGPRYYGNPVGGGYRGGGYYYH